MIITHLAVSGVGRFRTRHVVKGFGSGLNLLCAPNEYGKSTLFRALHACLFSRHGSGAEDIRTLATLGAQLPAAVEVGFERGGARYTVQKSFVQSRTSRLFKDGRLVADGRRADEQVWSILGVHENGRSVDESTFGLLWVRQGASFGPIEPSDTARSALSRLIEAEVGQVLGGERGERVRQSIGAQLAKEETDSGRPRTGGEWKRTLDAVNSAGSNLEEARGRLRELEADLQTLETRLARLRELEDPSVTASMRADLDRATQDLAAAQRAQSLAEAARAEVTHCELAHELARKRERELIENDERIAAGRKRMAELNTQLAAFEEAHRRLARAVGDGEACVAESAAALAAAEGELDRLNRLAIAAANAGTLNDLRRRLEQARRTRDRLAMVVAMLAKDGLSSIQLRRIETAANDLELKRQQREAKAPQITVELESEAGRRVRLQGEVIETSYSTAATGPVRIDVEGIAAVHVVPVAVAEDMTAVQAAQEALDGALRKAGVTSPADARERRARTEELEGEQRALEASLAAMAPGANGEDGVALLERQLAAAQMPLEGLADDEVRSAAAQPAELAVRRQCASGRRDECRRRHAQAQASLGTARSDLAATEFQRTACRAELASQRASLAKDTEVAPECGRPTRLAALAAAVAEAQRALSDAQEKAAALRASVPSEQERANLAARVKRLTEAIAGRDAELAQVREDVAALRARIATRGGDGLGEREAALADELALAERERARIERRLGALRLLRDTIDACRNEAREAYLAPIKRGMQPFLHALFPGAEAQFDEAFGIESLRRDGPDTEPFDYLSHGTREQIAVMVRLAFGRLLAERGQPAPVLLDDALVFSDDDRIERMFDVLTQAAEKHQVIVLTCRSRAFETFGGRRLTVVAEESM